MDTNDDYPICAKVMMIPLGRITPAPENSMIYHDATEGDPQIGAMVDQIENGEMLAPILLTRDDDPVIISGHRRYFAYRQAGEDEAPCIIDDTTSRHDDDFLQKLVRHNTQRMKDVGEILREQVILAEPDAEQSYQTLLEHRREQSRVSGDFMVLGEYKPRSAISEGKRAMLEAVKEVIGRLEDYWPISDRTIHYELLNDPPLRHSEKPGSRYANNRKCYKDLTDLLTRARLIGEIPFDAIADPTRMTTTWRVLPNVEDYIRGEMADFLKGYRRDLQQSQPNHIEIVGEKNTVEGSIRPVAMKYPAS
jgi:hypothetical protein